MRGPAPGAGLGVGSVCHAWTGASTLSRCFGKNEGGKEEDFLGGPASRARSNHGVCVPCTSSVATNPFPPVGCCGLASSGLSPEWPRECSGPTRHSGPSCLAEEVTMSNAGCPPGALAAAAREPRTFSACGAGSHSKVNANCFSRSGTNNLSAPTILRVRLSSSALAEILENWRHLNLCF